MATRGARQYVRHNIWNEAQTDGSLKWYTVDAETGDAVEIPADQLYFWTDEWQQGEQKVDEDAAAGRVKTFDTMDAFLADLDDEDEGNTNARSNSRRITKNFLLRCRKQRAKPFNYFRMIHVILRYD